MQKRILEQKRMQLISRHQRQNSGETQMSQAQEMMMRHSLNEGAPAHTNIDPFLAGIFLHKTRIRYIVLHCSKRIYRRSCQAGFI